MSEHKNKMTKEGIEILQSVVKLAVDAAYAAQVLLIASQKKHTK